MQLAPPHIHLKNSSKIIIRTFKNIFVADLLLVDTNCLIYMWWRMVEQAEITLNILRTSQTNPILLAYAQLFESFYFNAIFMEPPGTIVIAHKNPINALHRTSMEFQDGISA